MCVIDQKTYLLGSGREEIVEKRHYCHNAVGRILCQHIQRRDLGVVRTVERRPSVNRATASEPLITTSKEGRERRLYPLSSLNRRFSKSASSGQASATSTASPVDSAASLSATIPPVYKEVRPEAPMPPSTYKTYPSARQMTPTVSNAPPDTRRTVRPDGTASYERPPSLEMPRAAFNERTPVPRQSPWSSTNADIDEPEALPSRPSCRRVSFRDQRPDTSIDFNAATHGYASAGRPSSPGLGQLPRISKDGNSKGKGHVRVDSVRDEEDQARREQACLSGADRRQRARQSRDAEEAARERAESLHCEKEEASYERKERKRREAQDALEGREERPRSETMQRRIDAEIAQIAREQQEAERRRCEEAARCSTSSVRSYTYPPSSPTPSNSVPLSARRPAPVAVHNHRPASRDSIAEHGAAVIERYARAADNQQLNDALVYMEMEDMRAAQGQFDADPKASRRTSERTPRRRERRQRENERDVEYYQ
ncbi:hypothetical protein DOTSEDRAFT_71913 [Dothistroma septosporum NZE10]|uniref:Uncharacterized protein n=1 Tax=Dothistroma septosporum (strain NZE10 / CBS 128990) TaxID=675120 RepID=N1PL61_DOTSN|nr:hypothetical protein DOTSEDRAFT_71913 [Dothistroma septosporum NZE10]